VEEALPEYLNDDWEDVKKKLESFTRSLKISKVDTSSHCIYDLTPTRFLEEYGEIRNRMTEYILRTHPRPDRYDYMLKVNKLLTSISDHPLKINYCRLKDITASATEKLPLDRLLSAGPCILYNQFGTRTGRLTTTKSSFPILTMKREHRQIIEPHNDEFLELDFNGAEARTMLGMMGINQPIGDVHEFHAHQIFDSQFSREEVKTAFFAWLYGSRSATSERYNTRLSQFYDRKLLLDKYWDGSTVTTPYKKVIPNVDQHHALNYIIQSMTAELTLLQALKIDYFLRINKCQSRVSCLIHDAIIIDFSHSDIEHLPSLRELMSSTTFGKYVINMSRGKNLGLMKRMEL
jgi:hypothetical protein